MDERHNPAICLISAQPAAGPQGLHDLGVQREFAQAMAVNLASRRVMEKAGLTLARTFYPVYDDPIDGTELGEVEYELRRPDWERLEPT